MCARRYHRLMGAIQKHLLPLGVTLPSQTDIAGGYFIWAQLPNSLSASSLASSALLEHGVKVATGDVFQVQGDSAYRPAQLDHHVRLCFAWEEEDRLEEGVRRFACAVQLALKMIT